MLGRKKIALQVLNPDVTLASLLLRQGLVPSAPLKPRLAVSVRTLELYRVTRMRCPHLGIQAFVKALCDVHCVSLVTYSFFVSD